jgi:hypothetical protein
MKLLLSKLKNSETRMGSVDEPIRTNPEAATAGLRESAENVKL